MKEIILCKYGEIVLKGANRKYFEDMLCRELKKRGITHLPVVYSEEAPIKPLDDVRSESGKPTPGSIAFVPSVAGLYAASVAVKHLIKDGN